MEADGLENALQSLITTLRMTLRTELSSIWLPIQFGAIALAALAAWGCAVAIRRRFDLVSVTMGWPAYLRIFARALIDNFGVLAFMVIIGVTRTAIRTWATHPRTYILGIAGDLATAWVVIALVASLIRNPFINRLVSVVAWTIAALSILGLLDETTAALDARAIVIGGLRVTPLLVIKTVVLLAVALWVATTASNFLDRRVQHVQGLTPSIQVLLGKLIRIGVMTAAIVIVLSAAGIDLSVLAVFTGAIGVGIGLGMQKIVSNFVSGIILLADRSIKPGDVITVGDHFGWVAHMGARYTSVDMKDGRELLVPNEDLVTQRVINWTYSSDLMRLEVKFSTTYDSDLHKTRAAAVQAAQSVEQVLKTPPPVCHLTGYGASAIEYVLWFWIKDAATGPTGVRSEVMIALWDTFKREGIKLPIPGATRVIVEQAK
ncbi:MAG TPA: mechanosensitive ion channel domain-containing protein [Bradyrhizobium sp.]|nr:mechanosensitive ion channel domain-containing protein [Bradyrhizobium sp.]